MIEINIDKINSLIPSEIKAFLRKLNRSDYEVYLTGSCVRNIILQSLDYPNTPQTEVWEISTNATNQELEKYISPNDYNYYTAQCHIQILHFKDNVICKLRTYRTNDNWKEIKTINDIEYNPKITNDLIEDLSHRDFAINAMAYNPDREIGLIDPFGGLTDIENRMIRCVKNPYNNLVESQIRILRAIRIAYQLGFGIESKTSNAIKQKAYLLYNVHIKDIEKELAELIEIVNADNVNINNVNDDEYKILTLKNIIYTYSEVFSIILLKEIYANGIR